MGNRKQIEKINSRKERARNNRKPRRLLLGIEPSSASGEPSSRRSPLVPAHTIHEPPSLAPLPLLGETGHVFPEQRRVYVRRHPPRAQRKIETRPEGKRGRGVRGNRQLRPRLHGRELSSAVAAAAAAAAA